MDVAGRQLDARLELAGGDFDGLRVAAVGGLDQALVILLRELRVDRQPDDAGVAALPSGHPDRELDALGAARPGRHVGLVLARREHLLEQRAELDLAPRAARLDVGQHLLEVADAGGERPHLAQAAMHLLQPLADGPERLAQARLERRLQPLVHRGPHPVELRGVVGLQRGQAVLDGLPERLHASLGRIGPGAELGGERLQDAVEPGLAGLDRRQAGFDRGEAGARRPQPQRDEYRQHGDEEHDDEDQQRLEHGRGIVAQSMGGVKC